MPLWRLTFGGGGGVGDGDASGEGEGVICAAVGLAAMLVGVEASDGDVDALDTADVEPHALKVAAATIRRASLPT